MPECRPSVRCEAAAAIVAAGLALAACGTTTDRAAPTSTDPVRASTTAPDISTPTPTSTAPPGPTPIPTDPADLGPCIDILGVSAAMPSRHWPQVPAGWNVRYASTTRPGAPGPANGWSTLVRVDAVARVTGLVTVTYGPDAGASEPNSTVRGRPAWIGPETNRSGATGAVRAAWSDEGGLAFIATARGLGESDLRDLLDDLAIARGAVVDSPPGWRSLGSGHADGFNSATVIGLTGPGSELLETGYAPVEVQVDELAIGTDQPGVIHVPAGLDVVRLDVRLRSFGDRPALVTDLGDGQVLIHTTTADGAPVSASGPPGDADLLALAANTAPIATADDRLVGVPMGNVGTSPGAWCR